MSGSSLIPGARATAVLLVIAPLGEVVEGLLSPLDGSSTSRDLAGIAAHPGMFQLSVLIGTISTFLAVPALMGLAQACLSRSPRLARVAGWTVAAALGGFLGVRMVQSVELAGLRAGVGREDLARTIDHTAASWIGGPMLVTFLGGSFLGLLLLAVATWRAGFPRPACVLLALFQVVDLVVPQGRVPVAHLVLLVALGWCAVTLWSSQTSRVGEQQTDRLVPAAG